MDGPDFQPLCFMLKFLISKNSREDIKKRGGFFAPCVRSTIFVEKSIATDNLPFAPDRNLSAFRATSQEKRVGFLANPLYLLVELRGIEPLTS